MVRPFDETAANSPFPPYVEAVHESSNAAALVYHVIPSLEYAYTFDPIFVRAENTPFPYDTADHESMGNFPWNQYTPSLE